MKLTEKEVIREVKDHRKEMRLKKLKYGIDSKEVYEDVMSLVKKKKLKLKPLKAPEGFEPKLKENKDYEL